MADKYIWALDNAHCSIGFRIRHMMITNVKGSFNTFTADIITLERDFKSAEIKLSINAESINTGDTKRDKHLISDEFFYTDQFPEITFNSTGMSTPDEQGIHELWGELSIKGIAKRVCLNVYFGGFANDGNGKEKAGFTISGKINRTIWGLNWNSKLDTGGFILGDEVEIHCEIELTNMGTVVLPVNSSQSLKTL